MKLIRNVGLIAILGLLATASVQAQQVTPPVITPTTEDSYDPIVAALDSLVTLNHVVRFNSLEANCFDGSSNSVQCNIPSFSDEV